MPQIDKQPSFMMAKIICQMIDEPLPLIVDTENAKKLYSDVVRKCPIIGAGGIIGHSNVYEVRAGNFTFEIQEHQFAGSWEAHVVERKDVVYGKRKLPLRDIPVPVIGTWAGLLVHHLARHEWIRYYADDAALQSVMDRVFQILNRTRFDGNIMRADMRGFLKPLDDEEDLGTAVMLKLDDGTPIRGTPLGTREAGKDMRPIWKQRMLDAEQE